MPLAPAVPVPAEPVSAEIVVETAAEAPGERVLDRDELDVWPAREPSAYLRALPGLYLSAHGGRGKAWQILYRGFDAEHGGDLAVTVEGVPFNEPSNVHGHGYLDLTPVPTVLVERVRLRPGVDRADVGAFGTAAAVDLSLGLAHEGVAARVTGGTDRSGAVRLAWRPEGRSAGNFLVVEGDLGFGVGEARSWRHARVAAGVERPLFGGTARVVALLGHADFDSPGALRRDDLDAGRVDLYDAYPGSGGGRTLRGLAVARLGWAETAFDAGVDLWVSARDFRIEQDFTGFLRDPVHGDATRQSHDAASAGVRLTGGWRARVLDRPWRIGGGVEWVQDDADQRIDRIDRSGEPFGTELEGTFRQDAFSAWAELDAGWSRWVSLVPSVRVVGWRQAVAPDADADADAFARRWTGVVLPRARLNLVPHPAVRLFAGYGRGYRPPRLTGGVFGDTVTSEVVQGGLAGFPHAAVGLTAAGFWTRLSDELVFDHLSGAFVGSGASARAGVEVLAEARPLSWLRVDAAATFAHARFVATGEPVPYAPRWTLAAGVGASDVPLAAGRLTAGLRALAVAPRPLPGGFVSPWAVTADLTAAWAFERWTVGVDVDHVLGTRWVDGAFVYGSWWDLERPRSELPVEHVTAGTPTAARFFVEARW